MAKRAATLLSMLMMATLDAIDRLIPVIDRHLTQDPGLMVVDLPKEVTVKDLKALRHEIQEAGSNLELLDIRLQEMEDVLGDPYRDYGAFSVIPSSPTPTHADVHKRLQSGGVLRMVPPLTPESCPSCGRPGEELLIRVNLELPLPGPLFVECACGERPDLGRATAMDAVDEWWRYCKGLASATRALTWPSACAVDPNLAELPVTPCPSCGAVVGLLVLSSEDADTAAEYLSRGVRLKCLKCSAEQATWLPVDLAHAAWAAGGGYVFPPSVEHERDLNERLAKNARTVRVAKMKEHLIHLRSRVVDSITLGEANSLPYSEDLLDHHLAAIGSTYIENMGHEIGALRVEFHRNGGAPPPHLFSIHLDSGEVLYG